MSIAEQKATQRKYVKGLLMHSESLDAQSAAVCDKVISNPHFLSANTILCYSAMMRECSPAAIVACAREKSMRVAFPLCNQDCTLTICVPFTESDFVVGAYGIIEPNINRSVILSPSELDLIIVPALAYDSSRRRLGRGKGYYDRLLAATSAYTIGIAFDEQILQRVAAEAFDAQVDCVITHSHTFM